MTSTTTPQLRRQGERPAGRPPLPPGAGINTIKLDIEVTRDELASTLDDLFATFNPGVQIRSHPVLAVGLFLGTLAATAGAVVLLVRGRSRGPR